MILDHRLSARDPLEDHEAKWEHAAADILLSERSVSIDEIAGLLGS
jgi:acyl-CoA dehydrogenase